MLPSQTYNSVLFLSIWESDMRGRGEGWTMKKIPIFDPLLEGVGGGGWGRRKMKYSRRNACARRNASKERIFTIIPLPPPLLLHSSECTDTSKVFRSFFFCVFPFHPSSVVQIKVVRFFSLSNFTSLVLYLLGGIISDEYNYEKKKNTIVQGVWSVVSVSLPFLLMITGLCIS